MCIRDSVTAGAHAVRAEPCRSSPKLCGRFVLEDVAEPLVGGAARALNRGRIHINHGHIDPVLDSLVRKADVVEHAFAGVVIGGPAGVVAAAAGSLSRP